MKKQTEKKIDKTYAMGGLTFSKWSKDNFEQESFNAWKEDGNVIKNADGSYSTQDAQYSNSLKDMDSLKRYYYNEFIKGQYADGGQTNGGKLNDKHLIAKAIEFIIGTAIETNSIEIEPTKILFKRKNKNVTTSLNKKFIEDTIRMHGKSLEGRFAKGGKIDVDIYDFDDKMALINLGQVYEYAIKIDKMIKNDSTLEEWVKMKLTRVEQNIADVKHSLEGWEKYKSGGEIAKKQLLHIAKYSKELIEMIQGGSKLMSWQEDKLAVSSAIIDDIYHHLDYKMGNRAEDLDVNNEYAKGGEAGFNDAGTSMVLYHEKEGNWMTPKGQVYLYLYDVENGGSKLSNGEFDWVFYPLTSRMMAFQSGYIPPLKKIWTKKFQKEHKGSENLLGVIKAYLIEENGKKELYIDLMSVKPTEKKKGIMSYMIQELRDNFDLTQDQITFSDLTKDGEKFVAKKTYADGGSTSKLNVGQIFEVNRNSENAQKYFDSYYGKGYVFIISDIFNEKVLDDNQFWGSHIKLKVYDSNLKYIFPIRVFFKGKPYGLNLNKKLFSELLSDKTIFPSDNYYLENEVDIKRKINPIWESIIDKFDEVYYSDGTDGNELVSDQVKAEEYKWQFDKYSKYASSLSWADAEKKFKKSLTEDELNSIEIFYKKDEYADLEEHDTEKYNIEIVVKLKTYADGGGVEFERDEEIDEENYRYKDFYQGQGGIKFKTEEEAKRFIKSTKPFVRKQLRDGNFALVFNGKEFFIGEKIKINSENDEFAQGGIIGDCIDYIQNSESIKNNGYYLHINNMNNYVGSNSINIPKINSLCLITFNSDNQKNLKAVDTINSTLLASEIAKLLNIDIEIARIIVYEQITHSKPFTMDMLDGIKNKNIIIADRDTIVCTNISTQFAHGGDVPNEDKMFQLPLEMVVYVPSTQDVDKVISIDKMDKRVDEVKEYLANKFGGYTSADKLGGFVDSKGNLVNEDVVQVTSFGTKEAYDEHKEALIKQLAKWGKKWGQEAIGFEFEGDLLYVPKELTK
jgi:hypothetical protein